MQRRATSNSEVGNKKRSMSLLFMALMLSQSCKRIMDSNVQEAWSNLEAPEILLPKDGKFIKEFDTREGGRGLPLKARVSDDKYPYSDTYWPDYLGGIANRWNVAPVLDAQGRQVIPDSIVYHPSNSVAEFMNKKDSERITIKYKDTMIKRADIKRLKQLPEGQMLMELAGLSPAEKYDLFMGRVDTYPFTNFVVGEIAAYHKKRFETRLKSVLDSKKKPEDDKQLRERLLEIDQWVGLCNGWVHSASRYPEPIPVVLENPDLPEELRIKVPFGSADIKGLISHYIAIDVKYFKDVFKDDDVKVVGRGCNEKIDEDSSDVFKPRKTCFGTNAGTFHIILANFIGLQKRPLAVDLDKDVEVWNFPVFEYQTKVIRELGNSYPSVNSSFKAAPGTSKIVEVETVLFFREEGFAFWKPIDRTGGKNTFVRSLNQSPSGTNQMDKVEPMRYYLELDEKNEIIGGEWISKNAPDLIWDRKDVPFVGFFKKLQTIVSASQNKNSQENEWPNLQKF